MIEKRTVLILGAGASADYGYPLGNELKTKILALSSISQMNEQHVLEHGLLDEDRAINNYIGHLAFLHKNCEIPLEHIKQFNRDFAASPKNSIDSFLENRREFLALGKLLISMSILSYENYNWLSGNPNSAHWYSYLFNILAPNWETFQKNRITIITYNYDRSFETYFLQALMATFGKNLPECIIGFTRAISVIHVHGEIVKGHPFDSNTKHYDGEMIGQFVRIGAENLKIIHEEVDYSNVYNALSKSEQIFILGLGFHETNLQRLKLSDYSAPIYSTRKGISDLNTMRINDLTKGAVLFSPNIESGIVSFLDNEASLYGYVAPNMPKKVTIATATVHRR